MSEYPMVLMPPPSLPTIPLLSPKGSQGPHRGGTARGPEAANLFFSCLLFIWHLLPPVQGTAAPCGGPETLHTCHSPFPHLLSEGGDHPNIRPGVSKDEMK